MSLDRLSDVGDKNSESINEIVNRFCDFNSIYHLGMEPDFSILWIGFLRNYKVFKIDPALSDDTFIKDDLKKIVLKIDEVINMRVQLLSSPARREFVEIVVAALEEIQKLLVEINRFEILRESLEGCYFCGETELDPFVIRRALFMKMSADDDVFGGNTLVGKSGMNELVEKERKCARESGQFCQASFEGGGTFEAFRESNYSNYLTVAPGKGEKTVSAFIQKNKIAIGAAVGIGLGALFTGFIVTRKNPESKKSYNVVLAEKVIDAGNETAFDDEPKQKSWECGFDTSDEDYKKYIGAIGRNPIFYSDFVEASKGVNITIASDANVIDEKNKLFRLFLNDLEKRGAPGSFSDEFSAIHLQNFSYMEENGKWKDGSWQTEKLYDTLKVVCDE